MPCPPPREETYRSDPRIEKMEKQFANLSRMAPNLYAIHEFGAELPQECVAITGHEFLSVQFHIIFNVASYQEWLNRQSAVPALEFHRRFLQHLQSEYAPEALGAQDAGTSRRDRRPAGGLSGRAHHPHPPRPGRRDALAREPLLHVARNQHRRCSIHTSSGTSRPSCGRATWSAPCAPANARGTAPSSSSTSSSRTSRRTPSR